MSIEVASDFRRSSFSYEVVAVALATALQSGLDINTVLTIIGVDGGGLIGLLRWLRRRPVESIQPFVGGEFQVSTTDGDTYVVHSGGVLNLYNNSNVRYALGQAVEPLKQEGVTELRIGRGQRAETTISSDEATFFDPPVTDNEILQDKTSREFVEIVGLSFNPNNVWRFRTPDGTSFTSLVSHDRIFWRQVEDRDIQFADGDALEVDLHLRVTRDPATGSLQGEREIVRVIRRIPPPHQTDILETPP